MFAIIVGTHGLFAKELVKSCEMICGEQKNVLRQEMLAR